MKIRGKEMLVGFNSHRLHKNDDYHKKEIDFVEAINAELKYDRNILAKIVRHGSHCEYLQEDEEQIVLSVIQWLGTPVGQGFLERVRKLP